ncbi:MAG: hypothetical protein IT258_10205 [Saprospiraceae bacterium]|nr:hypothetical protein [Saprospiraceae bacterium]
MYKPNRKSGNGTSSRQWLYLYLNVPFIFLVKVGISGDYKRRAKRVAKHIIGWPVPIFAVRIPFAWQCEQAFHRFFRLMSIRYGGSREWYLFPVAPFAILVMLFAFAIDWLVLSSMVALAWWWLKNG